MNDNSYEANYHDIEMWLVQVRDILGSLTSDRKNPNWVHIMMSKGNVEKVLNELFPEDYHL